MKNLLRALTYFRPDSTRIAVAFGLVLLNAVAGLLKPWPLALIVDSVLGSKPLPNVVANLTPAGDKSELLLVLIVVLALLHIGQNAIAAAQNFLAIRIGLRGLARVRTEVFAWLQRLSMKFHQGHNQGDVIYRASWDTYAFQTLLQHGLFTLAGATLSLVLMFVVMWKLNASLAAVAFLIVPPVIVAMKVLGREMKQRSLEAHQTDSHVTSHIQQSIIALPLIQSFTREAHEQERFATRVAAALSQRTSQHGWEIFYWLVIASIFAGGAAVITWLGAGRVITEELTLGELLVFLGYLAQLYEPLNQITHVGTTVSDAGAGTQRVFEILDAKEEVGESPNARPAASRLQAAVPGTDPLALRGNVSFHDVTFGYQLDRPVLHGVTFSVREGESIAVIGPSGAGKSTLIQLLPRFYDPASGSVRFEGVDLRELRLKDVRANVSLVLQEPLLLNATLAENIAYGKPAASQEEIEAAARAAHADEFIRKLPQRYETLVGEGAARLSVGEKQRINVARAFLKDAPILVLDEPTSALDAESEALIVDSLRALMQGRTTFLVAHRLGTLGNVDKVAVLEAGRLTEFGTPAELAGRGGYLDRVAAARLRGA